MRVNQNIYTEKTAFPFSEMDISEEPDYQASQSIEEVLRKGGAISRFFIEQILPIELRENPVLRLNSQSFYFEPKDIGKTQLWHWHAFPNDIWAHNCLDMLWVVGNCAQTEVLGEIEVEGTNDAPEFPHWINSPDAQVTKRIVDTQTLIRSNKPFIHRRGPVLKAGPRFLIAAGLLHPAQLNLNAAWEEL